MINSFLRHKKLSPTQAVMTFAEFCHRQRRLEKTKSKQQQFNHRYLMDNAEIINPWKPLNK